MMHALRPIDNNGHVPADPPGLRVEPVSVGPPNHVRVIHMGPQGCGAVGPVRDLSDVRGRILAECDKREHYCLPMFLADVEAARELLVKALGAYKRVTTGRGPESAG